MKKKINKGFLVKSLSILVLIILYSLILIPLDKLLLIYASNKRNKYLTKKGTDKELIKIAKDSTSYKDLGKAIYEGSLVNEAQKKGYHHEEFSDYVSFGDGGRILWILGDSWMARLQKNHFNIFEENLNKYYSTLRIFSNSSWSPLLYTLVIRNRSIEYDERPDAVAIYLDQSDIGDDYCKYRPLVERNKNNKLKKVHLNKYITYHNYDFMYDVFFQTHNSGILYAIKYAIYRLFYSIRILAPGIAACEFEYMMAWNLGLKKSKHGVETNNYAKYFKRTTSELIDELNTLNPNVKILLVTHEWAQHGLEDNKSYHFKNNIKSIIQKISNDYKNVETINITTKDHYDLKGNTENIYDYPQDIFSHLLPSNYANFANFISIGIKNKLFKM